MKANRTEFSKVAKGVIGGRAGYRCSFPRCGKVTIGPGAATGTIASIGVAAHIYSASPNGPRGQGGKTIQEIESPENGIWLCQDHAKFVDSDDGRGFSAERLLSYKWLHETRITREISDIRLPFNWIESIVIHESPIFAREQTIVFSKVTLLLGSNGAGKTAVCDWIDGAFNASSLHGWAYPSDEALVHSLDYSVRFFDPEERIIKIGVNEGAFQVRLDGRSLPLIPIPLRMIRVSNCCHQHLDWHAPDTLGFLSAYFQESPMVVQNLLAEIGTTLDGTIHKVSVRSQSAGRRIIVHPKLDIEQDFVCLSNSQKLRLLAELAIAKTDLLSKSAPTILVLDGMFPYLDRDWQTRMLSLLSAPERAFQTIITDVKLASSLRWTGWEVVELVKTDTGVAIRHPG